MRSVEPLRKHKDEVESRHRAQQLQGVTELGEPVKKSLVGNEAEVSQGAAAGGDLYLSWREALLPGTTSGASLRSDKTFASQDLTASCLWSACLAEAAPDLAAYPRARTPSPPRANLSVFADGCHVGMQPWMTSSMFSREAGS